MQKVVTLLAIACVLTSGSASEAVAGTTWDSGGGADQAWGTGANWNVDDTVPGTGARAHINNGGTAQVPDARQIGAFTIGGGATDSGTLIIPTGGSLDTTTTASASYSRVGESGTGFLEISGGSLSIPITQLRAGLNAGSQGTVTHTGGSFSSTGMLLGYDNGTATLDPAEGTYLLSGSGSTVSLSSIMYIGHEGIGTYTQDDGTTTVPTVYLGNKSTGVGTYTLHNGTTGVTNLYVGYAGTGTFVQDGGITTVGNRLSIGDQATGTGTFTQSGGTVNGNQLMLAYTAGSNATYNLSGTDSQINMTGDSWVGYKGTATFTQDGGETSIGSTLYVGDQATGTGTLTQTAGSVEAANLIIGNVNGSMGTYHLSGTDSTLDTTGVITVGENGTGSFTQDGGTTTAGGRLSIGNQATGTGTFTQTDGTVNASQLMLGYALGSEGTYNLSGTDSKINVTGNAWVGYKSDAIFTQDGGAITVGGRLSVGDQSTGTGTFTQTDGSVKAKELLLGYNPGSEGTYHLSGTDSTIDVTDDMWVGYKGTGTFTQDEGKTSVGGTLRVGQYSTGTLVQNGGDISANRLEMTRSGSAADAAYDMNGGTLTLDDYAYISTYAPGVFTQTDGVVTLGGTLWITHPTATGNADGTYKLQGGELDLEGGDIDKGNSPTFPASFEFTGGKLVDVDVVDFSITQTEADSSSVLAPGGDDAGNPQWNPMEIQGDYTQSAGSLEIEIGSLVDFDVLNLTSDGVAQLDGSVDPILVNGYEPALGETFDILNADGGVLFGSTFATGQYFISFLTNDGLTLTVKYVPEPSTFFLLAIGLLSLLGMHWRRRHSSRS